MRFTQSISLLVLFVFSLSAIAALEPAPEGHFRDPVDPSKTRLLDRPELGFKVFPTVDLQTVNVSNLNELRDALSQGGRHVVLSKGITIDASEEFHIHSNVKITGNDATIRGGENTHRALLRVHNRTNVIIEKLNLNANRAAQGIYVTNSNNVLIQQVDVFNAHSSNINFENAVNGITIRYCETYGTRNWHGVETKDVSSRNYSIYSNVAYDCACHGFNLHAKDGEFAGNITRNNRYGGKFYDGQNVWVHHNHVHSNRDWSGRIGIGSSEGRPASRLRFYANVMPGIGIWPASDQTPASYADIRVFDNKPSNGTFSISNSSRVVIGKGSAADYVSSTPVSGSGHSDTNR